MKEAFLAGKRGWMDYKDFLEYIRESVIAYLGAGFFGSISHVVKNNGVEFDGLVIMEDGKNISPTLYLNPLYEDYQKGRSLSRIVEEIVLAYEYQTDQKGFDVEFFRDFEQTGKKIVYKLINYEKNERLLREIPHRRFLDLAVVCYCLVVHEAAGNASILIHSSHLAMWGIREDALFQAAEANTMRLLHAQIMDIRSIMLEILQEDVQRTMSRCGAGRQESKEQEIMGELASFLEGNTEPGEREEMFVLTNHARINGAACMLYPDVLREFALHMGTNLYILPSSVHEGATR